MARTRGWISHLRTARSRFPSFLAHPQHLSGLRMLQWFYGWLVCYETALAYRAGTSHTMLDVYLHLPLDRLQRNRLGGLGSFYLEDLLCGNLVRPLLQEPASTSDLWLPHWSQLTSFQQSLSPLPSAAVFIIPPPELIEIKECCFFGMSQRTFLQASSYSLRNPFYLDHVYYGFLSCLSHP